MYLISRLKVYKCVQQCFNIKLYCILCGTFAPLYAKYVVPPFNTWSHLVLIDYERRHHKGHIVVNCWTRKNNNNYVIAISYHAMGFYCEIIALITTTTKSGIWQSFLGPEKKWSISFRRCRFEKTERRNNRLLRNKRQSLENKKKNNWW